MQQSYLAPFELTAKPNKVKRSNRALTSLLIEKGLSSKKGVERVQ